MLVEKNFLSKQGTDSLTGDKWEQKVFNGNFEGLREPVAVIATEVEVKSTNRTHTFVTIQVGTNNKIEFTTLQKVDEKAANSLAKKNLKLKGFIS